MSWDTDRSSVSFEPLRPASRARLIVGIVVGPLLWVVALVIASLVLHRTWAIELGLLVAVASFLLALIVLRLLQLGRTRQEREYVDRR